MRKKSSKNKIGVFALPIALIISGNALAATTSVDITPDGAPPVFTIDSLDWNQSSVLSVDSIPLSVNASFRALTMAQLGNFQFNSNNLAGTGLNIDYEWTFVTAFQETVTGLVDTDMDGIPETALFRADSTAPSVFEIWYDPAMNANQLAGTGFNDGTLILSAELANDPIGNFSIDTQSLPGGATGPVLLDQFGADDWAGQTTLVGVGGTGSLDWQVNFIDPAFFAGMTIDNTLPLPLWTMDMFLGNASQQDPFLQVNPALQIWDPIAGAFNPSNIGNVNLLANPVGATSALFQGDVNHSFQTTHIPEPSIIALLGLGFLVSGFSIGQRRRG